MCRLLKYYQVHSSSILVRYGAVTAWPDFVFSLAVQDFGGRRRVAAVVTGQGLPALSVVRRGKV